MSRSEQKRMAGKVIVAGFEGDVLPADLAADCEAGALGGVVLFKRNMVEVSQVADLLEEVTRRTPGGPPVIAVDQEGGRVVRMGAPLTVLPAARSFGEKDDPDLTRRAGHLVGRELRALGFTVNFAPVLDVDTNPQSPVIGDRSYGGTVDVVIRHGFAFARGLRDGGVFPCAKHFPGHGDATVDSHVSLPRVDHDEDRLRRVELEPFVAWCRTNLGPVMTAHVIFEALDEERPATISKAIIKGELRSRMRFTGLVFTDDLEMGAVAQVGGPIAVAVETLKAGADCLLVCRSAELRKEIVGELARVAKSEPAFEKLLIDAAARTAAIGRPMGSPVDRGWLGSDEHLRMAAGILGELGG